MGRRRKSNKDAVQGCVILIAIVFAVVTGAVNGVQSCLGIEEKPVAAMQRDANTILKEQETYERRAAERERKLALVSIEQPEQEAVSGLEIPTGNPNMPSKILVRQGYTASYNKETLLPNWVAWHLTPDRLTGPAKRKNVDFSEDRSVSAPRADDDDYYNSGYDRGHLCPAADNKMSVTAMEQSFLFTNICPQTPNLNRGDWNELEIACRKWAKKYGGIYIVSGPILYKGKHKTIGRHRVTVPEAFFKVVLRYTNKPKAIGFIYKNEAANNPKSHYVNTVDQVERITGIDFFPELPDDIEAKVEAEANISEW